MYSLPYSKGKQTDISSPDQLLKIEIRQPREPEILFEGIWAYLLFIVVGLKVQINVSFFTRE